HARGFTIREVETLFQSRHAGKSFIKDWPVRLVAEVCVDTAKAFVEFRLMDQRVEELNEFARVTELTREPGRTGRWRRLAPELRFLGLGLTRPLVTPRVRRMYDTLMRTQWASPRQIQKLQETRLRRMIRHAYQHVPYYRELFERLKIRPEEIVTVGDLQKLPV